MSMCIRPHLKVIYCERGQSDEFQNIPETISNVLNRLESIRVMV